MRRRIETIEGYKFLVENPRLYDVLLKVFPHQSPPFNLLLFDVRISRNYSLVKQHFIFNISHGTAKFKNLNINLRRYPKLSALSQLNSTNMSNLPFMFYSRIP